MPITPEMLERAQRFRAALLARERRAASGIVRFYGRIWNQLQGDIRQLEGTISDMRAAGEDVGRGTIWRLERMKAIQRQANQEMAKFSQFAGETISGAQREAIAAGERDAHQLMLAGFPPDATIPIGFTRMPRESVEAMVGTLQDGSPLVDLLQKAVGDAGEAFGETMVTGLAAGWNPRKLAEELRSSFGMGLTRSLRIARTEQLRAYRTATLQSYQESGVVKGWERSAALDNRTCMACIMLDGKVYPLDEPMADHPQGRCACLPITPTWRELGFDVDEPDFQREMGPDWFERQDEATQRQMMGTGMYDAWKAGKFEAAGIPKLREDSVWGNSWVPKSLTELGGPVGAAPAKTPGLAVPKFQTAAEASQWLADNGLVQEAFFKGFDLETVQDIAEGVADEVNRVPSLRGRIRYIGNNRELMARMRKLERPRVEEMTQRLAQSVLWREDQLEKYIRDTVNRRVNRRFRMLPNVYAQSAGSDFFISYKYGHDRARFLEALSRDVSTGFHPIGCDTPRSVIDHELGHVIDGIFHLTRGDEMHEVYRDHLRGGSAPSIYGKRNCAEFMCEAWAEYLNNPNPRRAALEVGHIIERTVEEYQQ